MTFVERYGPWALVTGASAGIGAEFSRQLAAMGLNLILVARRRERIEELAGWLESTSKIQVKTIVADLSALTFCHWFSQERNPSTWGFWSTTRYSG